MSVYERGNYHCFRDRPCEIIWFFTTNTKLCHLFCAIVVTQPDNLPSFCLKQSGAVKGPHVLQMKFLRHERIITITNPQPHVQKFCVSHSPLLWVEEDYLVGRTSILPTDNEYIFLCIYIQVLTVHWCFFKSICHAINGKAESLGTSSVKYCFITSVFLVISLLFLIALWNVFLISALKPTSELKFLILSRNSWRPTKSGPLISIVRETHQSCIPSPLALHTLLKIFIKVFILKSL